MITTNIAFGLYHGVSLHYADYPLTYNLNNEGPYIFYKDDSILNINYIYGNLKNRFYIDKKEFNH